MYEYKVKEIVRIYDGDTVTCVIDLGCNVSITETVRLYGIDTPEIRGEERPQGLISKARLIELLDNEIIFIKTYKDKTGKYGRLLGTFFVGEERLDVNEQLVIENLAERYLK